MLVGQYLYFNGAVLMIIDISCCIGDDLAHDIDCFLLLTGLPAFPGCYLEKYPISIFLREV
jgi:hypothetical protein